MEEKLKVLYALQDSVLNLCFDVEKPLAFYLTGGTALNRFYCNVRISEDLDFFVQDPAVFYFEKKKFLERISSTFPAQSKILIDEPNFTMVIINYEGLHLKIDVVNELSPYYEGLPQRFGNIIVDNVENIMLNKVTAIVSRDSEKDVVDLLSCLAITEWLWHDIIEKAAKKAYVDSVFLEERLFAFPLEWLERIHFLSESLVDVYLEAYKCFLKDLREGEQSLRNLRKFLRPILRDLKEDISLHRDFSQKTNPSGSGPIP